MGAAHLPAAGFSFADRTGVVATAGESVSPFSGTFPLPPNILTSAGMSNHIAGTPYEQYGSIGMSSVMIQQQLANLQASFQQ